MSSHNAPPVGRGEGMEMTQGPNVTDEQLREWAELCNEATPGPWQPDGAHVLRPIGFGHSEIIADCTGYNNHEGFAANATLIALARTALPALLAEVRRLREALGEMEGERDAWKQNAEEWAEKLRIETARMDWLQMSCAEVRRPDADTLYVHVPIAISRDANGDAVRSRYSVPFYGPIRAAIDAAMSVPDESIPARPATPGGRG